VLENLDLVLLAIDEICDGGWAARGPLVAALWWQPSGGSPWCSAWAMVQLPCGASCSYRRHLAAGRRPALRAGLGRRRAACPACSQTAAHAALPLGGRAGAAHADAVAGPLLACSILLETEPQVIASRVSMRGAEGDGAMPAEQVGRLFSPNSLQARGAAACRAARRRAVCPCAGSCRSGDVHASGLCTRRLQSLPPPRPLPQTFSQAFASAKEHLTRSFLK
jgi:hypothetical protein